MATAVAKAATEAVGNAVAPFRLGKKQVFLPGHVVALAPPGKIRSPSFVSFHVPLIFNKLDLRDYLYHVYNVEVRAVRSWIMQQAPRQKFHARGSPPRGPWYRPRPKKMMTVELVKPFVFPKAPANLGPWDQVMYDRLQKVSEDQQLEAKGRQKNIYPLRAQKQLESRRVSLAKAAQDLVQGRKTWSNDLVLDEKWTKVQEPRRKQKGP